VDWFYQVGPAAKPAPVFLKAIASRSCPPPAAADALIVHARKAWLLGRIEAVVEWIEKMAPRFGA
jgi:hypothetical protein